MCGGSSELVAAIRAQQPEPAVNLFGF